MNGKKNLKKETHCNFFAEKGDFSNKKRPKRDPKSGLGLLRDPGLPKRDPVGSSAIVTVVVAIVVIVTVVIVTVVRVTVVIVNIFSKNYFYILTTEENFEGQRFAILAMFFDGFPECISL